jgi:bifunctional oligoribonuclease and PAP phosphatase NrnA
MGQGPQAAGGQVNGEQGRAGGVGGGTGGEVPAGRVKPLQELLQRLEGRGSVVLTTHVNADGDGTGSQAAMASWLEMRGARVRIVNPTPYPDAFRFLLDDEDIIADAGTPAAEEALRQADAIVVLDTAEAGRIGRVAKWTRQVETVVIDHHVQGEAAIAGAALIDSAACAAGELVYDLFVHSGIPRPWPRQAVDGIYTAIVTDTGSFRFSNTTRRAHAIAGDLIEQGVDPEQMYRRIFATVPLHRVRLLRYALDRLDVDPEYPISSITIERGVMEQFGATSDDLDGIVEHARSIEGTEVALLMRETSDGATKVSLRSAGEVDVNAIARGFGGGGHVKASGALVPEPLETAGPRVLESVRDALRRAGPGFRRPRGGA